MWLLFSLIASALVASDARQTTGTPEAAIAAYKAQLDSIRAAAPTISGTSCSGDVLVPPKTIYGTIDLSSCVDSLGSREDIYLVSVQAGQTIDIDFSSSAFEPYMYTTLNGTYVPITHGSGRETAHVTFTASGTYQIRAESLYTPSSGMPWSGPYTLIVNLSGGSTTGCSPDATTVCLVNSRFKVSITFNGAAMNANQFTPNSGLFSQTSDPTNIEVVLKMINACSFNAKYWVYAGGTTDQNILITVVDTQNGTTKTYNPPSGKPFQTITDSSAFSCP